MNKVILMGRLTKEPMVNAEETVARYTLAVDRQFKREGEDNKADFISCVVFGKNVQFVKNYLHQGIKIVIEGSIQTGSYVNKDGVKTYSTDVLVSRHEFAESKSSSQQQYNNEDYFDRPSVSDSDTNGFVNIDNIEEDLPF